MLSNEWLKAFAPVGALRDDNLWAAYGACVFFRKPPLLWVVTARHVVHTVSPAIVTVLVTRSSGDGVIVVKIGEIMRSHGLSWIEDSPNDLAASPMPTSSEFGITAVSHENCVPFAELLPSMPCFTLGCPYGLHGVNPQNNTPLVLDGVISGVDPANRRIYTSAPTFPGNSGGPLIAFRSPFNPGGGASFGLPTMLFAGVMLETVLVPDSAQRVPIHSGYVSAGGMKAADLGGRIPALHLGVAAPADAVLALLSSPEALSMAARVEALQK